MCLIFFWSSMLMFLSHFLPPGRCFILTGEASSTAASPQLSSDSNEFTAVVKTSTYSWNADQWMASTTQKKKISSVYFSSFSRGYLRSFCDSDWTLYVHWIPQASTLAGSDVWWIQCSSSQKSDMGACSSSSFYLSIYELWMSSGINGCTRWKGSQMVLLIASKQGAWATRRNRWLWNV